MAINPIWVFGIVFLVISVAFFVIFAYNIGISAVQIGVIVGIIFFTLLTGGLLFIINKILKGKKSNIIDLEKESREFIMKWWKEMTNEDLTYVNSKYQQRFAGEMFALWLFSRREGQQYLGVIVGSDPKLNVVKWDWLADGTGLEVLWEELSPTVPGYPSRLAKPEDTIFALRKASPKIIETKETVEKSGWEELSKKEKDEEEKKGERK